MSRNAEPLWSTVPSDGNATGIIAHLSLDYSVVTDRVRELNLLGVRYCTFPCELKVEF